MATRKGVIKVKKEDIDSKKKEIAESQQKPKNLYKKIFESDEYPEIKVLKSSIKILDTHINLEWLLSHFKAVVRYNLMTRKREIILPGQYIFPDDVDNDSLARIEYVATINEMPIKFIDKHLDVLAGENPYHPIVKSIDEKPWDGTKRLDDFLNTIDGNNPELDKILIRTWMTAAIAGAFSVDGFIQHGVLVLQGVQGIGKSAWVRALDPLNCGAVKTGALLIPDNKDSVIGLSRFWIVELGELDGTFNKTDMARLKAYITSYCDNVRVPWGRKESRLVRRTAYIATVNDTNFLIDDTGNRRWWTVAVNNINYEHNMNMQQVWAEVHAEWRAGALTYLPNDIQEKVNSRNKNHQKIDPIRELLLTCYDWETTTRRELTATQILIEMDIKKPTQGDCNRAAKILIELNGQESRKSNGKSLHKIPEKIDIYKRFN